MLRLAQLALLVASAVCVPTSTHRRIQADPDPRTIQFNDRVSFMLDSFYDGIPHSYNVPDHYFRSKDYLPKGLHPDPLNSQESIEDRVSSKFGLNLYDGATWEIGLALQNEFEVPDSYNAEVLFSSTTGRDGTVGGLKDIRGDTKDFKYGPGQVLGSALTKVTMPANRSNPNSADNSLKTIPGAYFFRMVSTCYTCKDPLIGSYAKSFQYKKNTSDPNAPSAGPTWDTMGVIIWNDWKPITGEQAWAAMIGPLQFLYIKHNGTVPMWKGFADMPGEVQLALSIMPAVIAMQAVTGSMYHCPLGTQMYPADPAEAENVSNENNFSMYAGLRMLEFLLANNTLAFDAMLKDSKDDVDKVIKGIEKWFQNGIFSEPMEMAGINTVKNVYQGGHITFDGKYTEVGIMEYSGFAVDCQTWGISTLIPYMGNDWVTQQLGADGAYKLWQQVKHRGGKWNDNNTIAGVGFTQVLNMTCAKTATDNNTCTTHEVWSAEWSFGAALMAKTIAKTYKTSDPAKYTELMADATSIRNAVMTPVKDGGLHNVDSDGGMLYGNKRYFIPWGWYANPVSSLCSTSWSIMDEHDYNPFVLGGGDALKPAVKVKEMATGKSEGLWIGEQ